MACVALTSLIATMKMEFVQPNCRASLADETLLKSFLEKLSCLQGFVQQKSEGGGAIRDLEIRIRDFALDAEDRIEIQLTNFLLANNTEDKQKASQQLHQTLREAAENAAELLQVSNSISNEADDEVVVNESEGALIPWLKHHAASEPSNDTSLQWHSSPMLEGRMIGRRRDHEVIMDKLTCDQGFLGCLLIVAIRGMPGIGKTTLATSVYNDPKVISHFHLRCWLNMSGKYNRTRTLHHLLWALTEADESKKAAGIITDDVAAKLVYKLLKGKRYLIVLDDFCNHDHPFYDIYGYLPDDENESRILVTITHFSRRKYSLSYIHDMTLLNSEESWDLYCNKQQHMASKFENIRSQIVEKCEGLPHSIVVVRERLSKCDNIAQEWKKVEKELELLGVLDSREFIFTYNQLPQHLKVCFLYFGVFPKRSAIKVKQLISLWIAEGFVNPLKQLEDDELLEPRNMERLQKQAYEYYLQELIDRSLILIDNWSFDRKIKICRMHSALHTFCVREAQKEGIFCAVNTEQHLQWGSFNMFENSCRWLSLYKHSFDYYVLFKTNTPRSVFFFQEDVGISVSFKLLRVLAFAPSSFLQRSPTHLRELVFLRYLSVKEWFEGLDYIVSINRNLQVLVIANNQSQLGAPIIHLPCTIWELPQLHHLELGNLYAIDPPRVKKENMQTLSWMCPTHGGVEVHRMFPNIKKLKICVFCSIPIILDNLEYLEHLERLTILVSFGCVVALPKESMFFSQLKKLRLNGTRLAKKDLMVIGKLRGLMVLKLENAIHGEKWDVAAEEFFGLKFLLLEDKKLKDWNVNRFSFPHLEHLVLRCCHCFTKIPFAMSKNYSLKLIELEHCHPSIIASAKYIKEYRHDRGNSIFEIKIKGADDESQCTHTPECSYTFKHRWVYNKFMISSDAE